MAGETPAPRCAADTRFILDPAAAYLSGIGRKREARSEPRAARTLRASVKETGILADKRVSVACRWVPGSSPDQRLTSPERVQRDDFLAFPDFAGVLEYIVRRPEEAGKTGWQPLAKRQAEDRPADSAPALTRGCSRSAKLWISVDGGHRPVPRQRPRKYPILKRIEYDTCMPERTVVKLCRWRAVDCPEGAEAGWEGR